MMHIKILVALVVLAGCVIAQEAVLDNLSPMEAQKSIKISGSSLNTPVESSVRMKRQNEPKPYPVPVRLSSMDSISASQAQELTELSESFLNTPVKSSIRIRRQDRRPPSPPVFLSPMDSISASQAQELTDF